MLNPDQFAVAFAEQRGIVLQVQAVLQDQAATPQITGMQLYAQGGWILHRAQEAVLHLQEHRALRSILQVDADLREPLDAGLFKIA